MSRINSNQKGKVGEREIANFLKSHGYDNARRSEQYCGAMGDADVIGLDGIHIEVKRVEQLNIAEAMAQAVADATEGDLPVVMHRKNRGLWQATMRVNDWIKIYNSNKDREYMYLTDLKIVKRLMFDKYMAEIIGKTEDTNFKPMLVHGTNKDDLLVSVLLDDWISEYKAYDR